MAERPTDGRDGKVCVAQIGAAHGLKGEVRLFSFTEKPEDVANFGPLCTADGSRQFEIVSMRPARDHFVARFRNIDDRNAAEMLRNIELYVVRSKLPAPDDAETYYHADLVGLAAIYADGTVAGDIVAVHNFGAGDLLEIRPPGGANTVLLPFTERVVTRVDIAAQQIVIDPPAGLFDASKDDDTDRTA